MAETRVNRGWCPEFRRGVCVLMEELSAGQTKGEPHGHSALTLRKIQCPRARLSQGEDPNVP